MSGLNLLDRAVGGEHEPVAIDRQPQGGDLAGGRRREPRPRRAVRGRDRQQPLRLDDTLLHRLFGPPLGCLSALVGRPLRHLAGAVDADGAPGLPALRVDLSGDRHVDDWPKPHWPVVRLIPRLRKIE